MTGKRRSELQFTGLGAIGVVADGDRMVIDLNARKLDLDVPEADIAPRWKPYAAPVPRVKPGYLKCYSEHVAPASEDAVMPRF
jgi:dihydroxy-acid dehydratase